MIGTLVFGADEMVADWVAARIPHVRWPEKFGSPEKVTTIGLEREGRLIAGFVYHGYDSDWHSIEMSMAAIGPRWATWPTIMAVLHYPFEQLGCNVVAAAVPHTNRRALKANAAIGFRQEGVLRHRFGRDHAVIQSMLRREYDRLVKERA